MSEEAEFRTIVVEAPSGQKFEAEIPCGTPLKQVAADFFDSQGWPTSDRGGRRQRAVVELVNPDNPEETKRLNGEQDICQSNVTDGSTLRIFSESIAGAISRARRNALVRDHKSLIQLAKQDKQIEFRPNKNTAPDKYDITFAYRSFISEPLGSNQPMIGDKHEVQILLDAYYPRQSPIVIWKTPIFHPNIQWGTGHVCLGVLGQRYTPGMGLARLVTMLAEMVQWRNFDASNAYNRQAARWAAKTENWPQIQAIGGYALQGPVDELLVALQNAGRQPITFRPIR